jgi:hypothetical protein
MSISIKDIGFFLVAEQFMSQDELDRTDILINKKDMEEMELLKGHFSYFKNINLIEDEVKENRTRHTNMVNMINNKDIRHYGSRIYQFSEYKCQIPIKTPYVYVEDYNGYKNLDYLENLAHEKGFVYFSTTPIVRYSKYFIIKRDRYNILERLHILKNAIGYIGFDKSFFSYFAIRSFDEPQRIIMPSGMMTEKETSLKFHPLEDLSFIHDDFSELMI